MMDPEAAAEVRDLVENHLSRGSAKDLGMIGLVVGLGAIAEAIGDVQKRSTDWNAILDRLRAGVRDTRAALEYTRDDPSLERLRVFADRQVRFAELLDHEVVDRLERS